MGDCDRVIKVEMEALGSKSPDLWCIHPCGKREPIYLCQITPEKPFNIPVGCILEKVTIDPECVCSVTVGAFNDR